MSEIVKLAGPNIAGPVAVASSRVTIVCVTFHSASLVAELAKTLARFPHVVVVDNASADATVNLLRAEVPHANIICNQTNRGYGAANNMALCQIKTEFALLLNPDCEIDTENLQRLVSCADLFERAALIVPQAYGGAQPQISYNTAYFEKRARTPYLVPEGPACAKFLIACCMLVRVSAFKGSFFDERFFLYCEDDDLCLEAYRRGHECLIEPRAKVQHEGGGSSAKSWKVEYIKGYHHALSRRIFVRKHVGAFADWKLRIRHLALAPIALVLFCISLNRLSIAKWVGRVSQACRATP